MSVPYLAERPPAQTDHLIGVDLAQGGADFTAIGVIDRDRRSGEANEYRVTHLERWRDARTARVPERLAAICSQLDERAAGKGRKPAIVVDVTGVGPFGLDPLRAAGFAPVGITIHGGDAVNRADDGRWRVPKRDIAGVIGSALQGRRLHIAASLPDARILRAELENFKVKINIVTGHDSYEAGVGDSLWREGEHDDLVLAVGLAVWHGERVKPAAIVAPVIVRGGRASGQPEWLRPPGDWRPR